MSEDSALCLERRKGFVTVCVLKIGTFHLGFGTLSGGTPELAPKVKMQCGQHIISQRTSPASYT